MCDKLWRSQLQRKNQCNSSAATTATATPKLDRLEPKYLMVVPCNRSIFLLSSAMMLWSSVIRSSYRSVVRSWTSSCSLMRWDCSHWGQENRTDMKMSWQIFSSRVLHFITSNHHSLYTDYAQNRTHSSSLTSAPRRQQVNFVMCVQDVWGAAFLVLSSLF